MLHWECLSVLLASQRAQLLTDSKRKAEELQPAQLQADRMLCGGKKGLSHMDLPLQTARAVGVATSMLGTDMSHRAGPGLGAAPTAPSTADTTVVMQLGQYWDFGRQRTRRDCW